MIGVFRDRHLGSVASGCGVRGANPHRQRPLRMPSDLQFGKRVILIDAMKKTTERFDGTTGHTLRHRPFHRVGAGRTLPTLRTGQRRPIATC